MDLLRRRGGSDAAPAHGPHLRPARAHPSGAGVRQGLRPGLDRRPDLLQAWQRSRLIYSTRVHRGRLGERRSFDATDYIGLLDAAHQQLGGPIVLVWDNLTTHLSTAMRQLIAARDWLHVIRLPAYAPDLNPTEGIWSHVKRSIGNLAVRGVTTSKRSCATGSSASSTAPTCSTPSRRTPA